MWVDCRGPAGSQGARGDRTATAYGTEIHLRECNVPFHADLPDPKSDPQGKGLGKYEDSTWLASAALHPPSARAVTDDTPEEEGFNTAMAVQSGI